MDAFTKISWLLPIQSPLMRGIPHGEPGADKPLWGTHRVYVSTLLEVCEQRDRIELYAKARKGLVKGAVFQIPIFRRST